MKMSRKITTLKLQTRAKRPQQEVVLPSNAIIIDVQLIDEGFCETSIELTILGGDETEKGAFIVAQKTDFVVGEVDYIGKAAEVSRHGRTGYEKTYYIFKVKQ